MTLAALVVLGQLADALAYQLAYGRGIEVNPLANAIGDPATLLAVKVVGALILGAGAWLLVRRGRRQVAGWLAVVGFVGALSELWAVVA